MKNIYKGYFLSVVGLILMGSTFAYFFGYKPSFMPAEGAYVPKPIELLISFTIGVIFVRVDSTSVDKALTSLLGWFVDIFKKKSKKDE